MKLTLQVKKGPHKGAEFQLEPGQSLLVGASQPARFILPKNEAMSKVHFSIEYISNICRIRDLKSENGTFVNSERVTNGTLQDGDEIVAGDSTFVVAIGHAPAAVGGISKPEDPGKQEAVASKRTEGLKIVPVGPQDWNTMNKAKGHPLYTRKDCNSGLHVYKLKGDFPAPEELIELLAQLFKTYMVLDHNAIEMELPDDVIEPSHLFDWMPTEVALEISPVLLTQDDTRKFYNLIDPCWGKGVMVIIFSREEREPILSHLRDVIRDRSPDITMSNRDTVLGCYSPDVMSSLLANYKADFVNHVIKNIDAVMIESTDDPEKWEIYARSEFGVKALDKLGLVEVEEEEKKESARQPVDAAQAKK